jgi:hypothetical protein
MNDIELLVAPILDPLTTAENALISFLMTEPALTAYNWQKWDSDVAVKQPRGYVNVNATSPLAYGVGSTDPAPTQLAYEVVLEGKPKRTTLDVPFAVLVSMLAKVDLETQLNSFVSDASLFFMSRAENMALQQVIEGDLRVRRVNFMLFVIWSVGYV